MWDESGERGEGTRLNWLLVMSENLLVSCSSSSSRGESVDEGAGGEGSRR